MNSKVTVKIYGQDYTIAGEKSEEEIVKIAEFVDNKMRLISRVSSSTSPGNIAILSAINIAEEYFDTTAEVERLRTEKGQLERDAEYYLKMLEDAKSNSSNIQNDVTDLKNERKEFDKKIQDMKDKCAEYETSFFDLQMENIQLKSELERLKQKQQD